jgi:predicted ABC-type ATPase
MGPGVPGTVSDASGEVSRLPDDLARRLGHMGSPSVRVATERGFRGSADQMAGAYVGDPRLAPQAADETAVLDAPGPRVFVLAGVNGAGKSSLAGALVLRLGGDFFNPDEAARAFAQGGAEANGHAWRSGIVMLEHAIATGGHYAFETTLGGRSVPLALGRVLDSGGEVHMRYLGLDGVERHLDRVRRRVAGGGHDIPEAKIRERYVQSPRHLEDILPRLTSLEFFDNSADLDASGRPTPRRLLTMERGRVLWHSPIDTLPGWASGIVRAALR